MTVSITFQMGIMLLGECSSNDPTLEFLNFQTPTNFTVNTVKFKLRGCELQINANEIANSEDSDHQAAPLGAV